MISKASCVAIKEKRNDVFTTLIINKSIVFWQGILMFYFSRMNFLVLALGDGQHKNVNNLNNI